MTSIESGHTNSPKPPSYVDFEQRLELQLLDRLRKLSPVFYRVKDVIRPDNNIGLGSVPELQQDPVSIASITSVDKEGEKILVTIPQKVGDFFEEYEKAELSKERLVVPIELQEQETAHIVSIHHQPTGFDMIDQALITAPVEVFEGIIAHELSHLFASDDEVPEFVEDILERRFQEKNRTLSKSDKSSRFFKDRRLKKLKKVSDRLSLGDEGIFDVIASRFGFKKQVLAKLKFMKDFVRLNSSFEIITKNDKKGLIRQLNDRIKMVKKYS